MATGYKHFYKEPDLEFFVKDCGREQCISSKIVKNSNRIRYSLHLVTDGKGYIEYDGSKTELGAGNVFLLFTNSEVGYYPAPQKPWSYMWVDFEGDGTEMFFGELGITRKQPHLYAGRDKELSAGFAGAVAAYESAGYADLECRGYFYLVLGRLVKLFAPAEQEQKSGRALVNSALTFVRDNYCLPLTVKDVAKSVNTHPDYLSHIFCQTTGINLKTYITSLKMRRAAVLLSSGKYMVKDAAQMVGYQDALHFSKVFSKYYKMTPTQYINKNKES